MIGALHRVQQPEEKEPEPVAAQPVDYPLPVAPVVPPTLWHRIKKALKGQK